MLRFGLGLILGGALVWAAGYLAATPQEGRATRSRLVGTQVDGERPAAEPAARLAPQPVTTLAPGTILLRVGEGYLFGEGIVQTGGVGSAPTDLYCQDIRHGASLHSPHGCAVPDLPLGAVGLPERAGEAVQLLVDAPLTFALRDFKLTERCTPEQPGLGIVRAASGAVYKLWLEQEQGDPDVLRRSVLLRFEEVPTREGGGMLRLPSVVAGGPDPVSQAYLVRIIKIGDALPGSKFAQHLTGKYERLSEIPPTLALHESRFLLLDDPLRSEIAIHGRGGIFAAGGIASEGRVRLESYSGIAVRGAMAGVIDVDSHAFLHLGGDLSGSVNVHSYASIVVDGDLTGTLKLRSYTTALLRGRLLGTLDVAGSCWLTLLLESYQSRAEIEQMEGDFRQVTLHLRESDLPPGDQGSIATWRTVIVADPFWKTLSAR